MRRAYVAVVTMVMVVAVMACGPTKKSGGGGGGDDDDDDNPGQLPHTLESVSITPTNAIIELDLGAPGSQAFAVMANYADGDNQDITGDVTWTVANPAVGSITNSVLQTPMFATSDAVSSKLTASYMGVDGLAQVTLVAYRKTGAQQDFHAYQIIELDRG